MNTPSIPTTKLASIALGAALLLAACGGSDSSADSGSSDDGSSGDVCGSVQAVADAFAGLEEATTDAEGIEMLGGVADALDDLSADTPDSVKSDVERLAGAVRTLSEVDPETGPSDEQQAAADDEDTDDSAEALEDFARSECDIDLGS